MLIKSGGGTGPVKPDNLLRKSKVPNPADEIFFLALGDCAPPRLFLTDTISKKEKKQ